MVNTVYALLVERAEARDLAELAMWAHVDDKSRDQLSSHREQLDDWLSESVGLEQQAEKALLRHLGGAA